MLMIVQTLHRSGIVEIIIKDITVKNNNRVDVLFEYPKKLNNIFSEGLFFAEYNKNISDVPKSILVIPFLANVLPIAWITNSDIVVDEIDSDFFKSSETIKDSFKKMYPNTPFGGDIKYNRICEKGKINKISNPAILFSGGADSLTTYIRHKDENPYLVTVWGADIKLHQTSAWELVLNNINTFSNKYRNESLIIKSNLRSFINDAALNAKYNKEIVNWWGGVQHGYALLGLCAPLSFSLGFDKIYIPSTHTESFSAPWGSHPSIDNKVSWAETNVIHDGYELGRQDKIRVISNHIKKEAPDLLIRVCYSSSTGNNCGKCEKCNRTITGLMLEGIDPTNQGFPPLNSNYVKEQFKHGNWNLSEDEVYMWENMQHAFSKNEKNIPQQYSSYFQWLKNSDFSKYWELSRSNKYRKLKVLSGYLPRPIYNGLKSLKQKLPL